ncbi:restriction endonuclease subunit S [Bacillus velezensis]
MKIKLKYISRINMGQSPDQESVNQEGVGTPFLQGKAEFGESHPTPVNYCVKANKFSMPNDILMSVRAPVGSLNFSDQKYVIGRGLCSITPKDGLDRDYLWYGLIEANSRLLTLVKGSTFEAVTTEDVKNLEIEIPSNFEEQQRISKLLSKKDKEISDLIVYKNKLINLLEQQRQSIITEAVTKGLNPNVKMKDSGVEWIGEIPDHWEEQKIKYLFFESNERNFNEDATLLSLFTSIGVKPRREMEEKGNKAQTVINYKVVRKGDIVVNKLLAWMGAIGLSEYNGVTSPDYDVYRPLNSARIEELYYHYYFRNHYFKGDCFKFGRGIMMMRWRTYPEQFKSILVPVPPKEEQTQIANYIEKKEKELALTIKNIEHSIQKLKEYRQALIYEAVTGKIDVRDMELD